MKKIISEISFTEFHKTAGFINKQSSTHLLLSTKKVLDKHNIPFLLVYGTLLGAYRDRDFIEHDKDVDIMLFDFTRPEVDKLIDNGSFAEYDLELIRKIDYLYSFKYENDYIDLYFFKDTGDKYTCAGLSMDKNQIDTGVSEISFLETKFNTVNNIKKYLHDKYGNDWSIPIKNKHAST